jgi:putative hemolysin
MDLSDPHLSLRLAKTDADRRAAERLRYEVFVAELGGDGPLVDHDARLERDRFDPFFDHLILVDDRRNADACEHVVGVYRLLTCDGAERAGQFYSEDEYDIEVLRRSGRRLLELGRSCVHRDHRGGAAMFLLWSGLADYVLDHQIEVLFSVASFHGTDTSALAMPLSYLHHVHLAPPEVRVRSRVFEPMDLIMADQVDRLAALQAIPPLMKAYLRLGGVVGDGAFIDRPFNTTDVCLIMDTARMNAKARDVYVRGRT